MNKIIIIGHPDSGHTRIGELLYRCGLKQANPSRREKLTAPEVSRAVCKGMLAADVETVLKESDLAQVTPDPLWAGLILDLMLGNLEQNLWGWTDSQALLLLEHLGKIDERITFVLVYDDPASVLKHPTPQSQLDQNEGSIHERLKKWEAYNSTMLRLFLRHRSQCLLVHRKALDTEKDKFLSMIGARLATAQLIPEETKENKTDHPIFPENGNYSIDKEIVTEEEWRDICECANLQLSEAANCFPARDAESFIIDSILDNHASSRQIFDELQACASLPLTGTPRAAISPEAAWIAFSKQRKLAFRSLKGMRQNITDLQADHAERTAGLLDKLLLAMQDLEELSKEKESMAAKNALLRKSLAVAETDNRRLIHERHKSHEELERVFLENRQQQQAEPTPPALLGAADRIKAHLSYRIGSLIVQQSKSIGGLVSLPFSLADEKKRYNEERRSRGTEKLPPIHEYSDAHAAERIKDQLSYRLGSVVVRNSGNPGGWIRMPFAILSCVRAFHRQRTAKS